MQELIQIQKSKKGTDIVSARDLHQFLEVRSRFNDWFRNRVEKYGFVENQEYMTLTKNLVNGGREFDFALTLNMAKELAMVENNERGRQARLYFLACEQMLRTITAATAVPALPATFSEALRQLAEKVESEERLLKENAELRPKAAYAEMVLSSVDECTTTTIAMGLGISAIQLNNLLCQMQVQYRHDGSYVLYARYQNKGLAKQRTFPFVSKTTNETRTRTYLVWTETGKEFIHRLLNPVLQQFAEAARQQAS